MAGTWRKAIMYAHDGEFGTTIYDQAGFQFIATGAKRFVKRQDRRAARREQKRITRNALIDDAYDQIMLEKEQRELEHELWLEEMELEAQDLWDEPDDLWEHDYYDPRDHDDTYEDIYCYYFEEQY